MERVAENSTCVWFYYSVLLKKSENLRDGDLWCEGVKFVVMVMENRKFCELLFIDMMSIYHLTLGQYYLFPWCPFFFFLVLGLNLVGLAYIYFLVY